MRMRIWPFSRGILINSHAPPPPILNQSVDYKFKSENNWIIMIVLASTSVVFSSPSIPCPSSPPRHLAKHIFLNHTRSLTSRPALYYVGRAMERQIHIITLKCGKRALMRVVLFIEYHSHRIYVNFSGN